MNELKSAQIHIDGIVQGVGFRPFVFNLAKKLGLVGWVRNTSAGVDILVDGHADDLDVFIHDLIADAPPLAHINHISVTNGPPNGFEDFEITNSSEIPEAFQPISPDVSICPDCLNELFDPGDRRYLYPFINCTNCGPRYTIIKDIPYDRSFTTMSDFPMCPNCMHEYNNPSDRRFHAQPIACPVCGPHIWFEYSLEHHEGVNVRTQSKNITNQAALEMSRSMLAEGKILAIKGLGGFHLACDANNPIAVDELRRRKLRIDKPFGLMMADMNIVRQHCLVSDTEHKLLTSHQRPIVILERKPGSAVAPEVAPGQSTLGIMLPYTPLHYLIFNRSIIDSKVDGKSKDLPIPQALVMTSGNISEEPLTFENDEARVRLAPLTDGFLMHDRPIYVRCDDSVVRTQHRSISSGQRNSTTPIDFRNHGDRIYHLRRSRGYAPYPVQLPIESQQVLATGAEIKNTICLTRENYAFVSHHIGDMENYETLISFENSVKHLEQLFRIKPVAIAYDLHPDYVASRYALTRSSREDLPAYGVQHHHAHIASCIIDNKLPYDKPIFGVAFDGTGYGPDGAIWGGEFLLASCVGYERVGHLDYMSLPGGESSIRKPARIALAYLLQAGLDWDSDLPPVKMTSPEERHALRSQIEKNINAPYCSSIGRLFDAAASLAGVRHSINYEAQAALEFEAIVDHSDNDCYLFEIQRNENPSESALFRVNASPVLQQIVSDYRAGVIKSAIASRFHNGVAILVRDVLLAMRNMYGISTVALSGGVWQNMTLLTKTSQHLQTSGFDVYTHHQVPANDGGISLGQASILMGNLGS